MARTQSVPQTRHTPRTRDAGAALVILLVLGWAATSTADSGPGIGIKLGAQTIEDPVDLDKTTQARLEVELSSPRWFDEHVDFALTFGGSYLGSHTETYTDIVDDTLIDDVYTDKLWLFDIRLAARLYPLGDSSRIRPYVGAGVGYYWFLDNWHNDYSDTFEDPFFPGTFMTVHEETEGRATLAQGFFPFLLAGVTVPVGDNFELTAELQYDFGKTDNDFELGGPIYMLGARFRF
ncbi:MAG: outer membrane beta-barrel protein [Planctomycetes bacterium]|nr:outer membrane beta-barrel protein [Planctomycetota bacterium]